MTVGELRKKLARLPAETPVYAASADRAIEVESVELLEDGVYLWLSTEENAGTQEGDF